MTAQHHVDALQVRLQSLRAAVVRPPVEMALRIDRLLTDTQSLRRGDLNGRFDPSLQSIENLLTGLRLGLTEPTPATRYRRAG